MVSGKKTGIRLMLLLLLVIGGLLVNREFFEEPHAEGRTGTPLPAEVAERRNSSERGIPDDVEHEGAEIESETTVSEESVRLHFSNAYGNDPTIGEEDPTNIDRRMIGFIDRAGVTLDAAFFELESAGIVEALLAAAKRGVRVRLVLEEDYAGNEFVEILRRANIPIVTDNRSGLMHNKFLVADDLRVWTGSVNATDNGAWRNNNNGLEIISTEIAENYSTEFREMFEKNLFGPRSPSNTPNTLVRIKGIDIYNYFAPEDDVKGKILRFIRVAKKQIRFMAFSFTDDDIGSLLVERHAEGIDVAGILETRASSLEYSELGRFRQAGLPVLTDANRYLMHHKVMVIDSLWTILGSYNFSASANERNDENIVIIKSGDLALSMLEEYDRVAAMVNHH